jgi:branched-chain amino acid transport system ATP-binding protein
MPPLLEIKNVTKRFGRLLAINDVSFTVAEGQMTFIVGPNGAGKTTLFNLITSVYHADRGQIIFKGQDITHTTPDKAAKLGIGRTFQIVKPLRNLTVLENVMLGAFMHTSKTSAAAAAATEVLKFLEMDNVAHLPARGMGLPMLKRLEIARALATKPKLMLLDEVVAGLPTSEALRLARLLKRLPEWGISAVGGVEHVMQVVMAISDTVVVLDHGTKIAEGLPQDVVHMDVVVEAYLGPKYKELFAK